MGLRKKEYIERYGEEAWEKYMVQHRAASNRYVQKNKEKIKAHQQEFYENNPGKKSEYQKRYREKNKEKIKASAKEYRKNNPDKIRIYYEDNKDTIRERKRGWRKTQKGRAGYLVNGYTRLDKKRGQKCTITSEWIVKHIFTSKCIYCGDNDWTHLGCDRIDDSQPHTPENVVCACGVCNIERMYKNMSVPEFIEYRKANRREDDNKLPKPVIVEMNGIKVIRKAGV